jgi:hypothetical protein
MPHAFAMNAEHSSVNQIVATNRAALTSASAEALFAHASSGMRLRSSEYVNAAFNKFHYNSRIAISVECAIPA